ncbi:MULTISPECIES: hypothetical protein [unclassified Xanthobacter]|uniref:hypothetical protein n=1 Tax=unclassified Xanthobacter TaxID=2623496 RepID=UPI001F1E9C14|nr:MULTISPECIES: hypothetical protein [unclassified Xanthobacter]
MARRSTPCTQADITRLIKAALAAGVGMERIAGVKLTRDGAVLLFGEQKQEHPDIPNEWDEVLKK